MGSGKCLFGFPKGRSEKEFIARLLATEGTDHKPDLLCLFVAEAGYLAVVPGHFCPTFKLIQKQALNQPVSQMWQSRGPI